MHSNISISMNIIFWEAQTSEDLGNCSSDDSNCPLFAVHSSFEFHWLQATRDKAWANLHLQQCSVFLPQLCVSWTWTSTSPTSTRTHRYDRHYQSIQFIMSMHCLCSLVPMFPCSRTQTVKLCRRGEPGSFCHVKSVIGREAVETP